MSAYIVSDDHIDGLLTFAIDEQASYVVNGSRLYINASNATTIGQSLIDENVRSVDYRYNGHVGAFEKDAAATYKFRRFNLSNATRALSVLKACDCFDYQASETKDYRSTVAAAIIHGIRLRAIEKLPGYSNANGWELKRGRGDGPRIESSLSSMPRKGV